MSLPGEALYFALNHPVVQSHSRHQRYSCSKSLSYIYIKNTCLCIEAVTVKSTKLFRTGSTYLSLNINVYLFFSFSFSSRVWDTGSSGWYSGSSSSDSEGVGGNTWSNQPFHISRTHSLGTQSLLFNHKRVKLCILVKKTKNNLFQ